MNICIVSSCEMDVEELRDEVEVPGDAMAVYWEDSVA